MVGFLPLNNMTETEQLLRDYVENGSDAAFREIVERYINFVYSTALRLVDNNDHAAKDVAQTVFTDLARKARTLPPTVQLGGWLHRHACFTASTMMRGERRRQAREKQAVEMTLLEQQAHWEALEPVLDAAINELPEDDRQPILLRFFEQRDFRAVGEVLGISDNAAQKRVSRAVEKLRELVMQRGATLGAAALTALLAEETVKAAPQGFALSVSTTTLAMVKASASVLRKAVAVKIAMAAVAVLLLWLFPFVLKKFRPSAENEQRRSASIITNGISNGLPVKATSQADPVPSLDEKADTAAPVKESQRSTLSGSNVFRLHIVAVDSGRPVPNVTVDSTIQTRSYTRKKFYGNRVGDCDVQLLDGTKMLELVTQIEGFADTRLRWDTGKAEVIPTNYTVRLARAVAIGGSVVGPDGEPVAGAHVGWSRMQTATLDDGVESHAFLSITTTTGADGRWHLERIAPEMLPGVYGSATHSNYTRSESATLNDSTSVADALKKETHVFHLGRAFTLSGIVIDDIGQPIANANVLIGQNLMSGSKGVQAAADGTFEIKGCVAGKNPVTAEAKGFATKTIQVEVTAHSAPVTIQLQKGKALRLLVVDDQGNPVPKARVSLNTFPRSNADPTKQRPLPTQARFSKSTDADGRLVWENAPDEELELDITAAEQMQLLGFKARPDGEEHVARLAPALVVHGLVRDASSAKPIKRFKMICGWPSLIGPEGVKPIWSQFDRDWLPFTDGEFRHVFESALILSSSNPGYVFKFEAAGYVPFVTRTVDARERDVEFDILLKPAETIFVKAILPNGRPAVLADVGWVMPSSQLKLAHGGFSKTQVQNSGYLRLTDAEGRFRLPAEESVSRVVVANAEGYGEGTVAELSATQTLQLAPWGRLEGTYTSGGKPAEGRELMVNLENGSNSSIDFDFSARVKVDEKGRFVFPTLPPGKHRLVYMRRTETSPTSASFSHEPLQEVEIRSGETTKVDIGSTGYTVKLRFSEPTENKSGASDQTHLFVSLHLPMPTGLAAKPEAMKVWSETPEAKLVINSFKMFAKVGDGSWVVENVQPGTYVAEVTKLNMDTGTDRPQTRVHGEATVIVPESPAIGTIDLGQIELKESSSN